MKQEEPSELTQEEAIARWKARTEQDVEERKEEVVVYAGFWRRFFALSIDAIIIGILAMVVGFIIATRYPTCVSYLPFLIAIIYFTNEFAAGRTLGQRMLGLRVVGLTSGEAPDLWHAFLRSLPLAILVSSTEITEALGQVGYPLSIPTNIIFGAIGAFVFLALPVSVIFHPRKRGIHDMLAGTLCVKATASPQPMNPMKIGRRLKIALIGIAVASLAVATVPTMLFVPQQEHPVVASWRSEGLVESAEFLSHSWQSSSGGFNTLEVRAAVPTGTLSNEGKMQEIMDRLAYDITFGEDVDILVINLVERNRFGFFWTTKCHWRAYSVAGKEEIFDQAYEQLDMFIKCQ